MDVAAGLDIGGSALKAWVASLDGSALLATATRPLATARTADHRAEFDPQQWWRAATEALREATGNAGCAPGQYRGVTAGSLRQGFVLLGEDGELGAGVLNSDRRGGEYLDRLRQVVGTQQLYELTGHWPAPELTLPKLLHVAEHDSQRWAAARRVLFVHDWILWRLAGVEVSEVSHASSGQLAATAARTWAFGLLDQLGLDSERLAPLVEAGTVVGELRDAHLGLPAGLPVVAGGGDTHLAAMGCGGLEAGTAVVVAGSTTPVQAAVGTMPKDPLRHPWVSAHLRRDLWATETNAGYAGMNLDWLAGSVGLSTADLAQRGWRSEPGAQGVTALVAAPVWSEETWARRPANAVVGFELTHSLDDLARAFLEGHAYAVRANLEDLERATTTPFARVLLTGGAARSRPFTQLLADVTGRAVEVPDLSEPAARAGAQLVAGHEFDPPRAQPVEPRHDPRYDQGYQRFLALFERLRKEEG
jgi:sugar (pentulose or hexulose) kinase